MSPPFSLYTTGIVVARDAIDTMESLLRKGEAAPNAASLPDARLHDDMKPLKFQIHITCNTIAKLIARATGDAAVKPQDQEPESYDDMYARLQQTRELLAGVKEEVIVARQDAMIGLPTGTDTMAYLPVHVFVTSFSLPNIMFHLVTTYNILRKEGVVLGKSDHLEFFQKTMEAGVVN